MNQISKIIKINLNYSYLIIAKKTIINANFFDINETILKDYKKIKRRLRNIMNQILKISKINLNYSYLLIAKKNIIDANFSDIKEVIFKDYKKIK